jgi:hypothetical protein
MGATMFQKRITLPTRIEAQQVLNFGVAQLAVAITLCSQRFERDARKSPQQAGQAVRNLLWQFNGDINQLTLPRK